MSILHDATMHVQQALHLYELASLDIALR